MNYASRIDARMRQALGAALVALAVWAFNLSGPLDQFVWTFQSRIASFEASGDIVFAGADEDLADPEFPARRRELAHALDRLAESGAARVYVDVVFDQPSNESADAALHAAMQRLGDRLYLVQRYETGVGGEDRLKRTVPAIAGGVQQVGKSNVINFANYVWDAPYTMAHHDSPLPSVALSMAGQAYPPRGSYPINYSFRLGSIPLLDLDTIDGPPSNAERAALDHAVGGRVVLIGNADMRARSLVDVPGRIDVPSSLIQIYAAETLKSGLTRQIGGFVVLAFWTLALCLSLTPSMRRWSGFAFALLAIGLPVFAVVAAELGVRVAIAPSVVFLAIYSLLVAKTNWRNRLKLVDPATNLPTFAALEADRTVASAHPTIVVGKIHRLEEVKSSLPDHLHREYIDRIVERLRLKAGEETFYIGHGHYLAWSVPQRDVALIRDHLEGLRALLSAPLAVGGELVDVGMTFAVNASTSPNVAKRLAAAVAAVEQTSEADNPIATEARSEEDLRWNISLQARIDAALANGEIYLVYQPKIVLGTGEVVGLEALVRWDDPEKGAIPPDLFIRQCESAGRMLHLTRYVLREALLAGRDFATPRRALPMAVNISSTLLQDREIVTVVTEVLEETAFDPARLTLEVTETYRIANLATAQQILTELAALGPKLSMDDFGVGAASFEALLRLPFGEIKIDRLFVSNVVADPKARGIVKHVLQLGKELRIAVVAEGVEDPVTLAALKELGCTVAQGFALAMPMRADQVLDFIGYDKGLRLRR